MRFEIDRRIWLKGEGNKTSFLHRKEDGKECCVGQFLRQCGIPVENLTEIQSANNKRLVDQLPEEAEFLVEEQCYFPTALSSTIASLLYETNDSPGFLEVEREERITRYFAMGGHEVVFTN